MTDYDYANFCNAAFALRQQAERLFAEIDTEHVRQLNGLVQSELAVDDGKVEPAYDFLAAILAEDVASREQLSGRSA